ncbi:MAG: bifunctional proline dehydrogenase/L-glutamate gamma-semialdehyde dehydrogenase [Rhodobacterales bacterium]|nr:MAG: bifunctional proline dehydrogenase/L-glutamate gamma-semialdehyde dehydrogenase [Rhodobacterales bacterium]
MRTHPHPTTLEAATYADQTQALARLIETADLSPDMRTRISARAAELVRKIRDNTDPGMMEVFLAQYGLSTDEGMSLVNASTWALLLTGKVLEDREPGIVGALRGAVKRLGEPVIRSAVGRAMKEMGKQFVLGETITGAMERAARMEARGYTYSYDMLGEAAMTGADAKRYHLAYSRAISAIAQACHSEDIRENPGISVKLSALHPRYEVAQRERVMAELVPRLRSLALLAKSAGMGLNIDAEEADRLAISLEVIETVLADPALAGWDGFGVVVQAYGPRAALALDALYDMATRHDQRIMVRLVKGAYWDSEIKRAQVEGMAGFPVFTQKAATDVSYIANARKLLAMTDRIYPQFATHNAHTVAAILEMATLTDTGRDAFEFQRLHGMGEALHGIVLDAEKTHCRIYAPVGAHRDLLAYLVRRLLENGANSSFVNQIVDEDVPAELVARDPFDALSDPTPALPTGPELFAPERRNSRGFDLTHGPTLDALDQGTTPFRTHHWQAAPLLAGPVAPQDPAPLLNPAETVGHVATASPADIETALGAASPWAGDAATRARILNATADLYEANHAEIFALLAREAGKTRPDAVAELREAVDFLRYYAANAPTTAPMGTFTCISPWNFPLAIFTGQIAAALAAGNAVLAKPAEQTPLIAHLATGLLHAAGVPRSALQLLPGAGDVGAALTSDARVDGVAFTGSTETALRIRRAMADNLTPGAPLLAETGGLNAMIVDSTALPEQAITAIVESAFQSAGQRCSALRCLYVQEDIAAPFTEMLTGAMDELALGDPWLLSTDCGPVIDEEARASIAAHLDTARTEGRLLHSLPTPEAGTFVAPSLIRVDGIADLEREVFGPVLHLATFRSDQLDEVIDAINATGYGLTFGLQTRIDERVQHVSDRIHAGNIYVNRNQIGAIVGSQPFGGEGLSGTGPKAGGPLYLSRFIRPAPGRAGADWTNDMSPQAMQTAIDTAPAGAGSETKTLPGPTGESNRLTTLPRPPLLCLGPGAEAAAEQARQIRTLGGAAVEATGNLTPEALEHLTGFGGVLFWGDADSARPFEQALARRDGPILPLITGAVDMGRVMSERHLCVDTTASGGNAALLGGAG